MIKIRQLTYSYGKQKVLDNVSMSLEHGQCVALAGPNGAGKTTLIKCLLQIIHPDKQTIFFNDQDVLGRIDYRRSIGYMPQINRFPEHMRVHDLFRLMKQLRSDVGTCDTSLYSLLGIDNFAQKKLGTLSEGMKQKVNASLAFYFNPDVLILDEPTASLDPEANAILKEKINEARRNGKAILLSSHLMSDLDEMATHIAYMESSRLILNKPVEILYNNSEERKIGTILLNFLKNRNTNDVKNNSNHNE